MSVQTAAVRCGGSPVDCNGVRMPTAEGKETLLGECVFWALGQEHVAELRTAHHKIPPRTIGFQRRQRSDHPMLYDKGLENALSETAETTIRKRDLSFVGAVQRFALLLYVFPFPSPYPVACVFLSFLFFPPCSSNLCPLSMYQVCFSSSILPDLFASLTCSLLHFRYSL